MVVDRTADVLERISQDVDKINREVFIRQPDISHQNVQAGRRLEALIEAVGTQGDLAAKARESLASLEAEADALLAESLAAQGKAVEAASARDCAARLFQQSGGAWSAAAV